MEGVIVQKYRIAVLKEIPNMFSNTFLDFISDMGVTDHRHYRK